MGIDNNMENENKKLKAPFVRMTKAAQLRLLNGNPLLKCKLKGDKNSGAIKCLNLDNVSEVKNDIIKEAFVSNDEKKSNEHTKDSVNDIRKRRNKLRKSFSAEELRITKDRVIGEKSETSSEKYTYTTTQSDLKRRLSVWLKGKTKNPISFQNLKTLSVHEISTVSEDNKENFDTSYSNRYSSYENLKIDKLSGNESENEELLLAPSDLLRIATKAIGEIEYLISKNYPREDCESWLSLVHTKCPQIVSEPRYWECRAKLEELKGEIGGVVKCYQKAVEMGAKVSSIENSVLQVMEKHIGSTSNKNPSKSQVRNLRNVLTSTIIQCAMYKKTLREKMGEGQSKKSVPGVFVNHVRKAPRFEDI